MKPVNNIIDLFIRICDLELHLFALGGRRDGGFCFGRPGSTIGIQNSINTA